MIKRMSKATSLLLAAATVMSLSPLTGVSAAERLETKTGTINLAIPFEGGKYIYDGYKSNDDQTGLYYNSGDKDKQLEDVTASTIERYGDKYAIVNKDTSDEYMVDLSTGTVLDQDSSYNADSVTSKLKASLTRTDRYGTVATGDITLNKIGNEQYGQVWYNYTAKGFKGYVNDAGKYIDTDVTANMYVSIGSKMVKVEEFGKANSDSDVVVTKGAVKELAQDNDNIYRQVTVDITGTGVTTGSAVYIQKISKAQGTTKDDAYLPSTVTSYEVSKEYDSDNTDKAADAINNASDFRVINGVIYAIKNEGDVAAKKVTVTTIKLKKDKVNLKDDLTGPKLDTYLAEKDVEEYQDVANAKAVSIDVDGNVWAVYKGEIVKFDGTNFTTVYNCDRSFDRLEVYNADSLIGWKDSEDVYATVTKAATNTTTDTTTTTTNKGWVKTDAGWTFYNNDGSQAKGQWIKDTDGTWYFLQASGVMKTGWFKDTDGNWYFLQSSGAMKTGWFKDADGTWYYLQSSGAMKTGWFKDTNGTWYFLKSSGAMAANETTPDGYYVNASGAWVR